MALILECCQCRAACSGGTFAAWLEEAQKAGLDSQDRNRHRAEANDPSLTSGATAATSVVEKAATQSFRALESAVKGR